MALRNETTGEVIILKDVRNIVRSPITFYLYENPLFKDNDLFAISNNIDCITPLDGITDGTSSIRNNIKNAAYTEMKTKPAFQAGGVYQNFVIGAEKNWLFSAKDWRVVFLKTLVDLHLKPINSAGDLTTLGQLIRNWRSNQYDFYKYSANGEVVYISATLYTNNLATLQPYIDLGQIFTEAKNGG